MQLVKNSQCNNNILVARLNKQTFFYEFKLLYEGLLAATTMPSITDRSGPNTPDRPWSRGELVFILKRGL